MKIATLVFERIEVRDGRQLKGELECTYEGMISFNDPPLKGEKVEVGPSLGGYDFKVKKSWSYIEGKVGKREMWLKPWKPIVCATREEAETVFRNRYKGIVDAGFSLQNDESPCYTQITYSYQDIKV